MKSKSLLKKRKTFKREVVEWTVSLGVAIIIALIIKSNVFSFTKIFEISMQNTFFEGDRVFQNKLNYSFKEPKREDIIILNKYEMNEGIIKNTITNTKETINAIRGKIEKKHLIKRVIGIPGDEINIVDGYVYLNGKKLEEYYAKGKTYDEKSKYPIVVPENKVFVLGDNRENSIDSRALGLIDYKQIEGKVLFRIWPLDKFGSVYEDN